MNLQENISRIKVVMGLLKEYEETQPDIKNTSQNNLIYINSISQVPKVGTPMNREEFKEDGISKLSWDNIVIVRASDEIPTINKGNMVLHTSKALKSLGFSKDFINNLKNRWKNNFSDESWEEFAERYKETVGNRWTKHFTLNHMVSDNMGGQWSDVGLVYLMPATAMVNLNGKPASLYAIDTWYSKSVVLPADTVILYTDTSKDKVEEMSIQFNADIENQKLKYPIYLLKINSLSDVNKVIESMGYTVIKGFAHYSEGDVDAEIRDFSKTSKTPSFGLHWNTFFHQLENNTASFYSFFEQMEWLIKSLKDEKSINDWYNKNRRIIKSAINSMVIKDIKKIQEEGWDSLFKDLKLIKDKINNFSEIKNFKKDILHGIYNSNISSEDKRYNFIELLKKYPYRDKNEPFEEFIDEIMPK